MKIYLTGIDGSGKSSILKELENTYKKDIETFWARYEQKYMSLIVNVFKRLKTKEKKQNISNKEDYEIWGKFKKRYTQYPLLSSLILHMQYFDYRLQIKKLRKTLKKDSTLLQVVDRFTLDFIVDQTVNFGDISNKNITQKLIKELQLFDKIIFLDVDIDIAFKRKNDIPAIEYLIERKEIYNYYIKKLPNAISINNNNSLKKGFSLVKKHIEFNENNNNRN